MRTLMCGVLATAFALTPSLTHAQTAKRITEAMEGGGAQKGAAAGEKSNGGKSKGDTSTGAKSGETDQAKTEEFQQFNPQTYTCAALLSDIEKNTNSTVVGAALIWAHGYQSAIFGTDETGPLDEKAISDLVTEYVEHCKNNKNDSFVGASRKMTEPEETED